LEVPLADAAEALFGSRLRQAELGVGQAHLFADLFLGLLVEVEPGENLAFAFAQRSQQLPHDLAALMLDEAVFRVLRFPGE